MTDAELLARVRAMVTELDELIPEADRNMKYHTRRQLIGVRAVMEDVEKEMAWHVED